MVFKAFQGSETSIHELTGPCGHFHQRCQKLFLFYELPVLFFQAFNSLGLFLERLKNRVETRLLPMVFKNEKRTDLSIHVNFTNH